MSVARRRRVRQSEYNDVSHVSDVSDEDESGDAAGRLARRDVSRTIAAVDADNDDSPPHR